MFKEEQPGAARPAPPPWAERLGQAVVRGHGARLGSTAAPSIEPISSSSRAVTPASRSSNALAASCSIVPSSGDQMSKPWLPATTRSLTPMSSCTTGRSRPLTTQHRAPGRQRGHRLPHALGDHRVLGPVDDRRQRPVVVQEHGRAGIPNPARHLVPRSAFGRSPMLELRNVIRAPRPTAGWLSPRRVRPPHRDRSSAPAPGPSSPGRSASTKKKREEGEDGVEPVGRPRPESGERRGTGR